LGYNSGTSDGIFGPRTEQALKDFQASSQSLKINGIFDKMTREFLEGILNSKI
jgi:peptidoglycan hydrolase-like protein with peptidoglycan-binding domain